MQGDIMIIINTAKSISKSLQLQVYNIYNKHAKNELFNGKVYNNDSRYG
jgi:hypothetical protein